MPKIPHQSKLPPWVDDNLPVELATSTLFRFSVLLQAMEPNPTDATKTQRKRIEVDILPDLDLDYEIIDKQMAELPAQYAFWSAVYSEVRLGAAIAERKLKARRAEIANLINAEYRREIQKAPAAELVKLLVESDPRLNEAEMSFQHAQMQTGKLYHMLEALKMKAELARSLLGLKKQDRDNT